jgi:fibronectin-binding autotransporter adhesin
MFGRFVKPLRNREHQVALLAGLVCLAAPLTAVAQTPGLASQYYQFTGINQYSFQTLSSLQSSLATTVPTVNGITPVLNLNNGGATFPGPFATNAQNFVGYYSGMLDITSSGTYNFGLGSDDGSVLWVDGQLVVNDNNYQGFGFPQQQGTATLSAGYHNIVVGYYQGGGGYSVEAGISLSGGTLADLGTNGTPALIPDLVPTSAQVSAISGNFDPGAQGYANLTIGTDNANSTFSGNITYSNAAIGSVAGLLKTGTGQLVMTGSSNLGGAVNIVSGGLQLGDGTSGHDPIITPSGMTNNGTLTYNVFSSQKANYSVTGAGSLTKAGPGTLTLAGPNTYTGQTLLTNGTLVITASNSQSGLYEGLVNNNNSADTTSPIPRSSLQAVARWGTSNNANGGSNGVNIYPVWGNNTTWGYSGYLDNTGTAAVAYYFGKSFDDFGSLVIDGQSVINNGNYGDNAIGSITLSPGLHYIDLRFGQGGGGVGPNSGVYGTYGIGYNTVVNTGGGGTWNQFGTGDSTTQFLATISGAPASDIVMSSNTTLDVSGSSLGGMVGLGSLGDAAGSPTGHRVLIGNNTLIAGLDNASTTFSGVISGGGSFNKSGGGLMVLAGSNIYSGSTTVTAGTLQIGNGGTTGSINSTSGLVSNGMLTYKRSDNVTLSMPVSGFGGLGQVGSGTLLLTGANTYTGATVVNTGTLLVGNGSTVGTIASTNGVILANSGSLVFNHSDTVSLSGPITGSGSLVKNGGGALNLSSPSSFSGPTYINSGVVRLLQPTTTVTGFGPAGDGTGWTVNDVANIKTAAFTSNVLTLTDANNSEARSAYLNIPVPVSAQFTANFTYQAPGATRGNVADGWAFVLQNQGVNALGAPGGALGYYGTTPSAGIVFNIYGGNTVGTNFTTGGNNIGYRDTTAANVNPDEGDPIQVNLTYDGTKYLTETLTDLTTSGTWSNTYTVGSLASSVGGGTAFIGFTGGCGGLNATQQISNFSYSATPVNVLSTVSPVYLASGGTLDLNGIVQQQIGGLNDAAPGNSGVVLNSSATSTSTFVVTPVGVSTFSGTIQSGGGLGSIAVVMQGTGTEIFAGNNSYNGGTTFAAGVLSLASSGAIGSVGTLSFTGGTMQMTAANTTDYSSRFSTAANQAYAVDTNGQNITWATGLTSPGGSLSKAGSGALVLTGSSTYSGPTTVGGGTLQVGIGGGGASIAATSQINLSNNAALIFNHTNPITLTAPIIGVGSLTKAGPGTLGLQGPGAYTGPTTISSGLVVANDQSLGFAPVNVLSGGTLQVGTGAASPGLSGSFYNGWAGSNQAYYNNGLAGVLAHFNSETPVTTQNTTAWSNNTLNTANNLANCGDFPSPFANTGNTFDALFQGTFAATTSGVYTFQTGSDDGSGIYVDGQLVVNNFFQQGVTYRSGTMSLTPGYHNIDIIFYQTGGGLGFAANYEAPGATSFVGIPDSLLAVANTASYGLGIDALTGNGKVDLNSGVLKVGVNNSNSTFAGVIMDSVGGGTLFKTGTGSLTLTGQNTYTGGTTLNQGTLQLGDGTSGHDPALVTSGIAMNNSSLVYNVATSQIANYAISGSGAITKLGAGTLQLGTNSSVASTVALNLNGGTTALVGNAAVQSSVITVQPAATLDTTAATALLTLGAGQVLTAGHTGAARTDINGSLALNGGVVNIGIGAGNAATLTENNGTFTLGGGSLNFDLTSTPGNLGGANDMVNTQNLAITASTYLDFNTVNLKLGNGVYPLFNFTGTLTGGTTNLIPNFLNLSANGTRQKFNLVTTSLSNGTVELAVVGSPANLVWSGTAGSAWDLIQTVNWLNTGTGAGDKFYNNDAVTFDDTGHTGNVNVTANLTPGNIVFNNNNLNYTLSGTGALSGAIGLTKTGSGTVVLANSNGNQFTGATTISGGALVLGSANAVQDSSVSVNVNNGLGFSPAIGTFNIANLGGTGNLVLSDSTGGAATISFGTNNANTTYAGNISGNGGLTLVGTGAVLLTGSNTYGGNTTINAGSLQLGNASAVQGSTVALNVNNALLFGAGIGTFSVGGLSSSNALSLLDTAGIAVTLNVGGNGQNNTFSGALTGSGAVVKTGAGLLSLAGSNITYSGNTTVSAGTLQFNNAINFSNGNLLTTTANTISVASGAMLSFNTDAGVGTFFDGAITQVLGATTGSGTIVTGGGTFQKTGAGILGSGQGPNLATNLTFAMAPGGLIDVEGGSLRNGGYAATTWTNNQASMNIAAGANLDLWDGHDVFVDALTGSGVVTKQQGNANVNLTVGVANGSGTFSGYIENPQTSIYPNNGIAGSTVSLVKTGSGIEVLTGPNTYTGPTSINGGTLQIGNGGSGQTIATVGIGMSNNTALVFNHADAMTVPSVILGTGSVLKTGAGTLSLQGAGAYTGPTRISQGVVIANDQTLGASLVIVASNATLQVGTATSPGLNGTFYNGWSGNYGTYTNSLKSMLSYFNSQTLGASQNTTNWSNNTLNTGNNLNNCGDFPSGFAGSGNAFDALFQGTFMATTSGTYNFQTGSDDGSGIYVDGQLVVNNFANQGVTYKSGSIALTAGYHTIDIGYVQTGGGLGFAANYEAPGATSFTGIPDALLATPNTFANGLTMDALTGSGLVDTNGGVLTIGAFNGSSTFTGAIIDSFGGGSLIKAGSGIITLTGSNTYPGATTVSGGTLQIGNGGTTGSIDSTSGVVTNSTLAFNRSDSIVFPQTISGVGGLAHLGSGVLTLTGPNTYSGPTLVTGGTLQVGNGGFGASISKTLGVTLTGNASLIFNHADNVVFDAAIVGSGRFTKTGAGTATMSGPNTYSGPTTILGGVLQLQTGNIVNGFGPLGDGTGWTVNSNGIGSAPFSTNVLTLTDGANGETRSAFDDLRVPVSQAFSANFTYQAPGATRGNVADGSAFVLQEQGVNALGGGGGQLGYTGIANPSVAVAFNIYNGHTVGTNIATNGVTAGGVQNYLNTTGTANNVNFDEGDQINVSLNYDGANLLTETLHDLTTGGTFSTTYTVGNLASSLGANTAFIGFSGATGGANSTQQISNFSFTTTGPYNVLPKASSLYISSQGTLDLNGANQQVESLIDVTSGSGGVVLNSSASGSILTLAPTGSSHFSGSIEGGNPLGSLKLVVNGTGTQILSGTDSYTGGTLVLDGILLLNNSASLPTGSSLTVGSGSAVFGDVTPLAALSPAGDSGAGSGFVAPAASSPAAVPEPGSLVLLAVGALLAFAVRWSKRRSYAQ